MKVHAKTTAIWTLFSFITQSAFFQEYFDGHYFIAMDLSLQVAKSIQEWLSLSILLLLEAPLL